MNNGKYRDIGEYLRDYDPVKAARKYGQPTRPKPLKITPKYERIVKTIKTRDLPQWFCWTCRRWHTSAVERADCPHCGRALRQNGRSLSAWRVLAL